MLTPIKQRRPHKMPAGRLFETPGVDAYIVCYSVLLPVVLSFIQVFWKLLFVCRQSKST